MAQTRRSYAKRNLTGQKFGKLTPIEWIRGGKWRCICDCGNETIVDTRNLMTGHTRSCGCGNYDSKNAVDMTGYEDENLMVLGRTENRGDMASWMCICKHCGRPFVTRGSTIRNGQTKSCGCIHSKFERKIIDILLANNIEFDSQYTFPGLVGIGGKPLRFDFAIFDHGQLCELIEYNGLQHYKKIPGIWGEEYEMNVEHDRRKREFCEQNGIPFKVISYNDPIETLNDILY